MSDSQQVLREFKPKHKFFVGIDSDGCAFDTMEIKQKECFTPNTIKFWNLQPVSKYAREAVEFVNLYSKWRGFNRFPALLKVFEFLHEREEVKKRNVKIPEGKSLKKFIDSGLPLGNPSLKEFVAKNPDDSELKTLLEWSLTVNKVIEDIVKGVPPFPFVRESLEKIVQKADMIVVSQTPGEALVREWEEHGISKYAQIIAGQEMGSKSEHLKLATTGKYETNNVLMMGDAFGDLKAARDANALFFPINPGHEEKSWELFYNEAFDVFIDGKFADDYETKLIKEFENFLPDTPPWEK